MHRLNAPSQIDFTEGGMTKRFKLEQPAKLFFSIERSEEGSEISESDVQS